MNKYWWDSKLAKPVDEKVLRKLFNKCKSQTEEEKMYNSIFWKLVSGLKTLISNIYWGLVGTSIVVFSAIAIPIIWVYNKINKRK